MGANVLFDGNKYEGENFQFQLKGVCSATMQDDPGAGDTTPGVGMKEFWGHHT